MGCIKRSTEREREGEREREHRVRMEENGFAENDTERRGVSELPRPQNVQKIKHTQVRGGRNQGRNLGRNLG